MLRRRREGEGGAAADLLAGEVEVVMYYVRRAKNAMYKALRRINPKKLEAMCGHVEAIEVECRFGSPPNSTVAPARAGMHSFLEEFSDSPKGYEVFVK